jgi:hypothetical protein
VAIALGLAVVAGLLTCLHRSGDRSTPEATLESLTATLAAGDVETLLRDESLGFRRRAEREVSSRGTAEVERLVALQARRLQAGREEYERRLQHRADIEDRVRSAGSLAFDGLSMDQKYEVWVGTTYSEWALANVLPALSDEDRRRIGDPSVVVDGPARQRRILELGMETLWDTDRRIVEQAEANPALAEDPYVKPVLEARDRAGRQRLDEAIAAWNEAERRAPDRPPAGEEQLRRQEQKMRELGLAALDPEDRAFFSTFVPARDEAGLAAAHLELGLAALSETERRDIVGLWLETGWGRDRVVAREGRRLYAEFLRSTFAACRPQVEEVTLTGGARGSLLRSWHARVRLRWQVTGGVIFVLRDGTLERHADGETVPPDLLRAAWADRSVTWGAAVRRNYLDEELRVGGSPCETYLGNELAFVAARGRWVLLDPDEGLLAIPRWPWWLVRIVPVEAGPDVRPARGAIRAAPDRIAAAGGS